MAKEKAVITHCDMLGNEIPIGAYVASNYSNGLAVFKVIKMSPKMVQIERLGVKRWNPSIYTNRYPKDLVLLDPQAVTFHVLKNLD